MTYPPELQAYYDERDAMMDMERKPSAPYLWAWSYGLYKVKRYAAVKAGYLPETPEFG